MKKQYFADIHGNTASITEKSGSFELICRNRAGKTWKHTSHVSKKAAKSALTKTGMGWYERRAP